MKIITLVASCLISICSYSQSIDTTFGVQGKLSLNGVGTYNNFQVQTDGKLLFTGKDSNGFGIISRFNADGSYDNTFGTQGIMQVGALGSSQQLGEPHILSDNSIILYNGINKLIKINNNGTVDNTFTNLQFGGGDFIILSNGKIVSIEMEQKKSLIRYNANGALDTTYGNNGTFTVFTLGQIIVGLETNPLTDDIYILDSGNSNSNYKVWQLYNNNVLNSTSFNQGSFIWATDFRYHNNALYLSGHSSPSMFSRLTKLNLDLSVSYIKTVDRTNFIPRNKLSFQNNGNIVQLLRHYTDQYSITIKINNFNDDGVNVSLITADLPEIEYFDDGMVAVNNFINKIYYVSSGYNNVLITRFNQSTLSLNEFDKQDFYVYPNPTSDIVHFNNELISGILYSIDGKVIVEQVKGKFLNLSNLTSGLYILKGTGNDQKIINIKIIKQ